MVVRREGRGTWDKGHVALLLPLPRLYLPVLVHILVLIHTPLCLPHAHLSPPALVCTPCTPLVPAHAHLYSPWCLFVHPQICLYPPCSPHTLLLPLSLPLPLLMLFVLIRAHCCHTCCPHCRHPCCPCSPCHPCHRCHCCHGCGCHSRCCCCCCHGCSRRCCTVVAATAAAAAGPGFYT
jgi:hypothetical protein